MRDQYFVNACTIHIDDLERKIIPLASLRLFGNVAEIRGQEPPHGLKMRLILIGQRYVDIEFLFEVID